MTFYLGTHMPSWFRLTSVPLFVSARRLRRYAKLPAALGRWALDSGGFSELRLYGAWRTTPQQYAAEVRRWRDGIGKLDWAAAQDWMCEPFMLAKTGLTVREHQSRTVQNYLTLRAIAPDLPFAPVLQGWERADYLRHWDEYRAAGVHLDAVPVVGLGSVCRRQNVGMVQELIRDLARRGAAVHAFGFKVQGLGRAAPHLASADSMAWSKQACHRPPLDGCVMHARCNNCIRYAMAWRSIVLDVIRGGV